MASKQNFIDYLNSVEPNEYGRLDICKNLVYENFDGIGSPSIYVELRKNYNGSGKDAFGGAKEWGVIQAHIAIPVNMSKETAIALHDDIIAVLEKHNFVGEL